LEIFADLQEKNGQKNLLWKKDTKRQKIVYAKHMLGIFLKRHQKDGKTYVHMLSICMSNIQKDMSIYAKHMPGKGRQKGERPIYIC